MIEAITFSSKSTPIGGSPLVWGPVTWEGKSQAHPIQSSNYFKWQWDVSRPDMLNEPQPHHAGTTRISWMSKGFHPAILVAFPPETPSALSQSQTWLWLLLKIPTRMLHENLESLNVSWFWRKSYCMYRWGSSNLRAETWHFWAHVTVPASSLSAWYWGRWLCVGASALNW